MNQYTHYVQTYTKRALYNRFSSASYRSHNDWNYFFKVHAYLKELGCPVEVYLEGVFTKYKPKSGCEYPLPNMLIYYSFLVMEYLKTAKISQGNFYQIPDSLEVEMAKQVGRGVISYLRLKEMATGYDREDFEEFLIKEFPGSFDDYYIVANPSIFMKSDDDAAGVAIFNTRWESIKVKFEYFMINFVKYERLVAFKNRVLIMIETHLTESNKDFSESLADVQFDLEEIKYNI